mmetsp:Transcript_53797/g.62888  ORF Transcript_53797/g.62888 Transcript_53797/m.62888 type:complete len:87 (-) Transcript_53797:214-474(-)
MLHRSSDFYSYDVDENNYSVDGSGVGHHCENSKRSLLPLSQRWWHHQWEIALHILISWRQMSHHRDCEERQHHKSLIDIFEIKTQR